MALFEAIDSLPQPPTTTELAKPEPPWRENELIMLRKAKGEDVLGSNRFSVRKLVSRLQYSWDQTPASSKWIGSILFVGGTGAVYVYSQIYNIKLSV